MLLKLCPSPQSVSLPPPLPLKNPLRRYHRPLHAKRLFPLRQRSSMLTNNTSIVRVVSTGQSGASAGSKRWHAKARRTNESPPPPLTPSLPSPLLPSPLLSFPPLLFTYPVCARASLLNRLNYFGCRLNDALRPYRSMKTLPEFGKAAHDVMCKCPHVRCQVQHT